MQQQPTLVFCRRLDHTLDFHILAVHRPRGEFFTGNLLGIWERSFTHELNFWIFDLGSEVSGAADAIDLQQLAGTIINGKLSFVHINAAGGILYKEIRIWPIGISHHGPDMYRITQARFFRREFPDFLNRRQYRQTVWGLTLVLPGSGETKDRESQQDKREFSIEAMSYLQDNLFP